MDYIVKCINYIIQGLQRHSPEMTKYNMQETTGKLQWNPSIQLDQAEKNINISMPMWTKYFTNLIELTNYVAILDVIEL